jgi:hypothetical protein
MMILNIANKFEFNIMFLITNIIIKMKNLKFYFEVFISVNMISKKKLDLHNLRRIF